MCQVFPCISDLVKNLPADGGDWVWFLGWEDPLEEEMATHSSILVWRITWTEEPGGQQSMGSQELDTTEWLNHHYVPALAEEEWCYWPAW